MFGALVDRVHSGVIRTGFGLVFGFGKVGRRWKDLERSQWMSRESIDAEQLRKLRTIFSHAASHVPFYRARFAGLRPGELSSVADLASYPIVTRKDLQEHGDDMLAEGADRRTLLENHTGGSTGTPVTFFQDWNYRSSRVADAFRTYGMSHYEMGKRWAFLWGSDYDSRSHKGLYGLLKDRLLYNTLWINTFDLDDSSLREAAKRLIAFRPEVLVAYTSSAVMLARLLRDEPEIGTLRLRGIQTAAELLTAGDRALLEETFQCPAFDHYGSREFGAIAHECDAHRGLHVCSECNLVEIVDEAGRVLPAGEVGRIIVTNVNNFAMPLLRYDIGDMGALSAQPCTCGRGLPLLQMVAGRITSIIRSPGGKLLYGEFFTHLFYSVQGIRQFRVVQETREKLKIQMTPLPSCDYKGVCAFLREKILAHGDPQFDIEFERCERIPPSASGKYHFTISLVPGGG